MEKTKKPFYKRWWFGTVAAIVVIGIIGSNSDDDNEAETEDTPKEEVKAEPAVQEEVVEKELTVDELISKVVTDTLSTKANTGQPRVHKIEVYGDVANVWLNASENLTVNMTRKGMWLDTKKLLEEFAGIDGIELYQIIWMLPLTDKFGNVEDSKVMSLDFPRATIDQINFDNLLTDNIPELADNYWEHNAIK